MAGKNSANKSTYITKDSNNVTQIYGKTYGANKYETSLICYALSYMNLSKPIELYEINDNGLSILPKSCLDVIKSLGKVIDIPTGLTMEKNKFDKDNSLRSPRFIYNLLAKLGPKRCALCGCEIPELIEGAHLWPVADIKREGALSTDEKLKYAIDGNNGIWLCENHHKMFDAGLIQIDRNGKIGLRYDLNDNSKNFIINVTTITSLSQSIINEEASNYLDKRYEYSNNRTTPTYITI